MEKLSICVLIYKSIDFIDKCIKSLLSQTDLDYELVLIDNSSPDGSIDRAIQLLKNANFKTYKIVKIANNTGCGQGRTKGYLAADGKYIKNLDSDDMLPPNFVETIKRAIDEDDPDLICYGHKVVDKDGNTIRKIGAYNEPIFAKYNITMFWRYVFKKENAVKLNIDTDGMHYAEDRYFSLKLIPSIKKVTIINQFLYSYVKNENSTTNKINQDKFKNSNLLILSEYKTLIDKVSDSYEKQCLVYALTKFYISILSMNCKGEKSKIEEYYDLYTKEYLKSLHRDKFNMWKIIPSKCVCKESLVIQISYLLLKLKFRGIFNFIYTKLY